MGNKTNNSFGNKINSFLGNRINNLVGNKTNNLVWGYFITPSPPLPKSSPPSWGRLGSLEEPVNVATAPQRGANLHSRRCSG